MAGREGAAAVLQAAARGWLARRQLQEVQRGALAARQLRLGTLRRALLCWRRMACARARLRRRLPAGVDGDAAALVRRCGLPRRQLPGLWRVLHEEGPGGAAAAHRRRKLMLLAWWAWVAQAACA